MDAELIETIADAIDYGDGATTNARRIVAKLEAAGWSWVKQHRPMRERGKSR